MVHLIKKLDILSPSLNVSYAGQSRIKTYSGAFLSVLLGVVSLGSLIFLSLDIFTRANPITRLNRHQTEDTKIFLKDFPLAFNFVGEYFPINEEVVENFNFRVFSFTNKKELVGTPNAVKFLVIEGCKPEFFPSSANYLPNIPLEKQLCINPFKSLNYKQEVIEEDVFFDKDYLAQDGVFLQLELTPKKQYDNGLLLGRYGSISITFSMATRYPDLTTYSDPIRDTSTNITVTLSNEISKIYFFEATKEVLQTDSGLILKRNSETSFSTFNSLSVDTQPVDKKSGVLGTFTFSSPKLVNRYEREYLKLQTVLAQLSGAVKLFTFIFQIIASQVSKHVFYLRRASKMPNKSKNIVRGNDSNIQMNQNRTASLPSLWKFIFCSEKEFNTKFLPKRVVFSVLDTEHLSKEIEKLKGTRSEEQRSVATSRIIINKRN